MRHLVLVAVLVASLGVPGLAGSSAPLPYSLTFSGTSSSGTISGTFGGVPVSGTYSGGIWTLTVFGKTFASGTYSCASTCTFTGTTAAGKSLTFAFSSSSLTGTKTGNLFLSQLPTHGAWVSTVAQWANANLSKDQRGQGVSAAARIEGSQVSGGKGKSSSATSASGGGGGHRR